MIFHVDIYAEIVVLNLHPSQLLMQTSFIWKGFKKCSCHLLEAFRCLYRWCFPAFSLLRLHASRSCNFSHRRAIWRAKRRQRSIRPGAIFSNPEDRQPSQNTTTEGSMSAAVYMIHDCTPNPCSSENRDTESTSSIQNLLTKREHSCTLLCIATN